jgi:predicted dehydrogenase
MKKIRVGFIGCGGRFKAHRDSVLKMENVDVVALAEPIEERLKDALAHFPGARTYKNDKEFFTSESADTVDAIFICIEPTAHNGVEEKAVELGIPFLVEKPMAMDVKQAENIARMVEEKGLITAVGFQDRYLDLMEIVKENVEQQGRGGLVYGAWVGGIPGVWWWQKKSTCGGQLVEQNIHLLDGLRFLYGEPLSVYATATTGMVKPGVDASAEYDTDDHSTVVLRFENNVTATLVSGCFSQGIRPRCGLYIAMPNMVLDYRLRNNLIISTKGKTVDIARGVDQTYLLDKAYITAVETGDKSLIRSPYSDALKSLKICFAANESMESGQVIYFDKE